MAQTYETPTQGPGGSVWVDLVDSYNTARMAIAALATLSSAAVGFVNGWPRGPWVFFVSASVLAHAVYGRIRGVRRAMVLLMIDAVALGLATFAMDIITVTLLALAFLLISASVLEEGFRTYVMWAVDVALLGMAVLANELLELPGYSPEQEALSETVGLLFFAVAAVGLTRTLVTKLRRSEFKQYVVERQLSSFDSRYQAMLAHSTDGIAVTDAALRLVEVGVQNQGITGYGVNERVGGSILDLVIDEDRSNLLEAFHRVMKDPDTVARFRVRIRRRDDEIRWMNAVVRNLLGDPDLEGFVFNFSDVTEEQRARAALEDANRRLEDLVRSKNEFIASVSHELRTPLTAVMGMADLLTEDGLDEAERAEFRAILRAQARQSAAIVEDLLVAARADIGEVAIIPEPCPLADMVEDALRLVTPPTTVSVEIDPAVAVLGDSTRLRQVLRNLVLNAEQHGGDRITVSASVVDGHVSILLADDGPGVGEEEADRIFEPYHRSRRSETTPGSIGLGLSVSRILARLMGGELSYRRDGEWTVFELTLVDATPAPGVRAEAGASLEFERA